MASWYCTEYGLVATGGGLHVCYGFPMYFDGNLRPIFMQENRRNPGGLTDFPLKYWLFNDGILMSWFMVIIPNITG